MAARLLSVGTLPSIWPRKNSFEEITIDPELIKVNEEIPDKVFELKLPLGTNVQDHLEGRFYDVGGPGVHVAAQPPPTEQSLDALVEQSIQQARQVTASSWQRSRSRSWIVWLLGGVSFLVAVVAVALHYRR